MSPPSITESLEYVVIHHPYPNGVTYTLAFNSNSVHSDHYLIRCVKCHEMGLTWSYVFDYLELQIASNPESRLLHLRDVLRDHANQHNALVQEILNIFNLTRKHQGPPATSPYPSGHPAGMNEYGCPTGPQGIEGPPGIPDLPELKAAIEDLEQRLKRLNEEDKKKEEKPKDFRRIELDEEKP